LAAVLDHPAGPLHVITCCLEWERDFAAVHLAQARALAALLTDSAFDGPLPVLLAGDLNAPPGTPQIDALTGVLLDAWTAGGGDPAGGHTLSSVNPSAPRQAWQIDQRIDYVMARPGTPAGPVSVEQAFLTGGPQDGGYPSDHYAVVADFRLPAS